MFVCVYTEFAMTTFVTQKQEKNTQPPPAARTHPLTFTAGINKSLIQMFF